MIRAIIFDCFGVLTTDLWKEFVATLPSEQAYEASGLNHAYDAGIIDRQEFLGSIEELTGKVPKEVESLLHNELYKNTALLEYIAGLKQHYKIGLLSNIATSWITDRLLDADERLLFDDFVFSFQVGMTKPNPSIFELAASRLHVEPEECVFVDDIERYCTAAGEVGMQGIPYRNLSQLQADLQKLIS